ncbi:MAG: hypothetical protein U0L15_00415, partial [Oscillospiraceae bacterium]|nr:hypothetical protein [Oscillospiraceae bacterium]
MENRKMPEEERIVAQKRSRRVWQRVVSLLACVVVFCTTYALILPAITMERAAVCGREEHSHIEECFDVADPSVLICALEEHTHTDECRTGGETTPSTENIPVQTTETIPQITEANRETEAAGDLVVSDEGVGLLSVIEADNPVVLNAGVEGVSYPDFETEMNGLDKLKLSENVSIWIRETDAWRESGEGTGVGGYQFWTGQAATINIAIGSNESSTYRLYFQFTKAGGGLDVSPEKNGGAYTFHGQPITCKATEDPNTVYLEFTPAAGVTADIPIRAWYTSPDTAGGGLKVWGEKVSEGTTSDTIQFSWHTQVYPFALSAVIDTYSSRSEMTVDFHSENRGVLPFDPIYILNMESKGDPAVTWGRNYAASTDISAYLDMPAGFYWDTEFVNAINNKNITLDKYNSGAYWFYTFYAGEKMIAYFMVSPSNTDFAIKDAWVTWDEAKNKPVFHCRVINTSGKEMSGGGEKYIGTDGKEYTVQRQVRFIVCKDALTIVTNDETENLGFNEITEERSPLMCHFEAVVNYAHDNITADPNSDMNADLATELKTEKAIDIPKAVPRLSFGRSVIYPTYFGESFCDTLTLQNYGTVDWLAGNTAVQTVYQQMRYGMYITPENMEKMFQEEYGKELTIEITNATLGEWQEVTGTDGKTTAYLHPGNTYHPDANSEEPRYKLTINYNDETRLYQVAIAEYPDNTHSKTVTGNSVEEVLRKAGYGVTEADTYHFRWTQNEEGTACQLVPGETRTFHIYTDFKDTFKNLTSDNPGQYPNEKIDVRNAARFTTGGSYIETWYYPGSFYREVNISKQIFKNEQILEGVFKVKAGDVLDHQITLTNAGTGVYENLPIVDEIYGTQYLLAPV